MSTSKQDYDFSKEMERHVEISGSALDAAIDYISKEFNPEDVFSESQLDDWATKNDYVKK